MNVNSRKIIDESQIDPSEGIIYDHFEDRSEDTLPNAEEILDQVIQVLEYINTDELKQLKKTNELLYEQTIEIKFPEFTDRYYSVFKMLISGNDISPLFMMLEAISKVNHKVRSLDDVEQDIGKELNKFLPEGLLEKLARDEEERLRNDLR